MVFPPAKHMMRIIVKETAKKAKRRKIRAEYGKDIFGTDVVLSRLDFGNEKGNELNEMECLAMSSVIFELFQPRCSQCSHICIHVREVLDEINNNPFFFPCQK